MHLRSGKSIASGSTLVSKISTHNRKITPSSTRTPIIEDFSLDSKSNFTVLESKASVAMGDSTISGGLVGPQPRLPTHMKSVKFDTKLVLFNKNKHGCKLNYNLLNSCAIKMEDIPMPFDPKVMVNFQGDQYISVNGTRYLIMPMFDDMDNKRKVHQIRA